ncbi:MAG: hypothetical protein JWM52_420 [Candidatus Saccharibacteria bacterium]|nr:hypothetical protein [Candidatus Saccharibacteria bacterium]
MKKTDMALIVLIIGISAGVAYVIGNSIFGGMIEEGQKVQTVDPITSTVEDPSDAIFNDNAINPSVEVQVTETATDTTTTGTTDDTK